MRRILKKIKKRYLFLFFLTGLLACFGYFRVAYPGFSIAMLNQLQHATMAENKNLYACNRYWLDTMEQLQFDEVTGVYSFATVDERNLDSFARGKLAYHRGHFDSAIELIQEALNHKGENEPRLFWLAMSHLRQAEAENCLSRLKPSPSASPALSTPLDPSCWSS